MAFSTVVEVVLRAPSIHGAAGRYFHLHLISDLRSSASQGCRCYGAGALAAAQIYAGHAGSACAPAGAHPKARPYRVLADIEELPGIVRYAVETLVERLEAKCRELGLPCLSILGLVLRLFQAYLGAELTQNSRSTYAECRVFPSHRRAQLYDAA